MWRFETLSFTGKFWVGLTGNDTGNETVSTALSWSEVYPDVDSDKN